MGVTQANASDDRTVKVDRAPALSSRYVLSPEQVAAFESAGHIKLQGVLTGDEIDAYRPYFKDIVERNSQSPNQERMAPGADRNCLSVNDLWTQHPAARAFVTCRRFGRIAADLLGVEAVRLFRDQSFFKGPGGANTPWHQDAYFVPLDQEKVLALWIPLSRITRDLGPLDYVTGSHRVGYLGTSTLDDRSMDRFAERLIRRGFEIHNYSTLETGDLVAHSGWTLHSSRSNTSSTWREVIVIWFFADGARMTHDPPLARNAGTQGDFACQIRKQNCEILLPGVKCGELAQGPMVPLVYSRSREADF